jgi:serine/threonine protein kinase
VSSATRQALPTTDAGDLAVPGAPAIDAPSPAPDVVEKGLHFGELALLKELVTREQLESILRTQVDQRDRDERVPKIGTLLVREGIISKAEAKEILRLQRDKGPIAGYELLEHLGTGGMGCVFRAREVATDKEVALKILPPRATQNSRYRARFLREAQVTQKLAHPNLVRSFDQGECEDHLWFAMEFVPGMTLRERIKRFGAAGESEVRATLRQLLLAMGHYWGERIVHRDIKPENIIVTPEFVAKLTDLGLCRQLDDDAHLTRVGKTLGTPLYISPELAKGRSDIDIRSDLYSLAATVYHLACGVPPFEAASQADLLRAHVEQQPPLLRAKNPRLSEGLEQLLMCLLEKNADDRLATPEAVLEALERLEQGKPPLPADRDRARKTPRPGSTSAVTAPAPRRRGSTSAVRSVPTSTSARPSWRPKRGFGSPLAALLAFASLFATGVIVGAHVRPAAGAPVVVIVPPGGDEAFYDLAARAPVEAAAEVERWVRAHPDDVPGQVQRLAAVFDRLPEDTPLRDRVEADLRRSRERLDEQAFEALELLRASLIELVDARRFDDARARLATYPPVYRMTAAWDAYEELRREVEQM